MKWVLLLCAFTLAFGQMSSTSYQVPTHVLDGAGTQSNSASYRVLSAVSQPTAIGVATSTSYKGYLGYIYTIPKAPYKCGDANGDGNCTTADGFQILNYFGYPDQFPISSCWAANVNGDSSLTTSDGFYLLNYFGAGPALNCQPCESRSRLSPGIRVHRFMIR